MERTISEKHLFTIGKKNAQLRINVTTQDTFMYDTIRKTPQKGTVRVLADKYDKCSRPPLVIPKLTDIPKSPECFANRIVPSNYSRKLSLPSNEDDAKMVEKFHTVRENRFKKPRIPVNGNRIFVDSDNCYSLESSPPERKEEVECHYYEKIYGLENQGSPSANLEELPVDKYQSNSTYYKAKAEEFSRQRNTRILTLYPKPVHQKIPDLFDISNLRHQPPISPKKVQITSINDKLDADGLNEIVATFPQMNSKRLESGEVFKELIYDEPVAVDKSKSEKPDSDDEETSSYFHVLFLKNQNNFHSLPRFSKKNYPLDGGSFVLPKRCTGKPLPDPSKMTKEQEKKSSLDKVLDTRRKHTVVNIISSEKKYLAVLQVIFEYKESFEKSLGSSNYLTATDVNLLFDDCVLLLERHFAVVKSFASLEKQLATENDIQIGNLILEIAICEFEVGKRYLALFPEVKKLLHRLKSHEAKYNELVKKVCLTNLADVKLEELLFKPIFQLQNNISMWSDLLDVTSEGHPDHKPLLQVNKLAETFLCQVNSGSNETDEERVLKQGVLVEKGSKAKKLVKLFLFKEVLICTKEKISNGINIHRIVKWFIPLCNLKLETIPKDSIDVHSVMEHESEVNELQQELTRLQLERENELQNACNIDNRPLFVQSLINRKIDALQKKIEKQEVLLSLSLPILPLVVTDRSTRKSHHLLISSPYDQAQWIEALVDAMGKAAKFSRLIIPKFQKSHNSESKCLTTGSLNIIIHKLVGLKEKSSVACAIETDVLGHFVMKEQTNAVESKEPEWNESFDVDMEGVKMLRILAYKEGKVDVLLGKCTLELDRGWLSDNATFQNLMLNNELQLLVSLKFSPHQVTRRKVVVPQAGGMFGVCLKSIAKREGMLVPSIIKFCVTEIENRGLKELGIYRVSGLMTEINKIKASFDRGDTENSIKLLQNVDINVVTSLLKLFLRELPEALFTDSRYSDFIQALDIGDEVKRCEIFINLFKGLPSCNSASISYILRHILKVAAMSETNKMSLENLATVFGPTLLRSTVSNVSETSEHLKIARETNCVTRQTEVLLFYLRNINCLSKWHLMDQPSFRLL